MAAILLLVAGTLVVAAAGSLLLIRRASASTAEQQLYSQLHPLATHVAVLDTKLSVDALRVAGQYGALSIVGLGGDGRFTADLPTVLDGLDLRPGALHQGLSVAGTVAGDVYVLIPLTLTTAQKQHLTHPLPYQDQAVLVATRAVKEPVSGLGYFLLVGLVCMLAAGVVAYWLARRFSRPLVTAAEATERIAAGDLGSPIPVSPYDMPEFASLATAINAMSDRLQRARDQQRHFLLSVSHELRTPLTSIRGYAEALADGATDDVTGSVAIIETEARRLERLVRDLLDLARLDAERFSFELASVDAAEVAARTVDHLRPEVVAAGLTVTLTLPTARPLWVVTDGDRLHQLLSNLLENACKFARSHIVVGARADDRRVVLWVEDDGVGIPADELPRVFEPHFTSDRSQARRTGTGLGLAIVAELVTAMGGGVRAESPVGPDGGTRMVVWLPAEKEPAGTAGRDGGPTGQP
jgi:two-component system sensor histidine kinase BaeS